MVCVVVIRELIWYTCVYRYSRGGEGDSIMYTCVIAIRELVMVYMCYCYRRVGDGIFELLL